MSSFANSSCQKKKGSVLFFSLSFLHYLRAMFLKLKNFIIQVYVWLVRFRYRCGYGVHSPFAFSFISNVVYEKGEYYAYRSLEKQRRLLEKAHRACASRKIDKLLLRLANFSQPDTILVTPEVAELSVCYLKAGRNAARFLPMESEEEIGLLYIGDIGKYTQNMETYIERATKNSLYIIGEICESKKNKDAWKNIQQDERVGITFDLYNLGIVFFDRERNKQHYIVNF